MKSRTLSRLLPVACTGLASMAAAVALTVASAPAAHATNEGGVADPNHDCPNGYTVKGAEIHDRRGFVIGQVELRWANSCGGNWARTTSYTGNLSEIEARVARGDWLSGPGSAYSVDYNVRESWTYYIRIQPSDPACAKGRLFYDGYWAEATACSDH
ncbi:hypothetical protein C5E51_34470 [Nocardia nova]|uniref:hypothetical protein n=1 Tax=Nocardia nova TaxID=37330 RepID=UPI000CEA5DD3|nr:hypothetical protein [Nocardia nova]PPJ01222.1 hypothetical protein C5E51_34470 [Nocardia nova]